MFIYNDEISLSIKHVIITCHLFYHSFFIKIKRKMRIKINIAKKIVKKFFLRVEINNFLEILIYIDNIKNKNIFSHINDDNKLFKETRNIIFKHFYILFEKIINNKKNLHIFDE